MINVEEQKLKDIKSFYNISTHSKLYGNRNIFNNSEYRLTNITGRKLDSFLELKILPNANNAIINVGFNSYTLKQLSANFRKSDNFLYSTFNSYINQIRNESILANIKVIYYSMHNNLSLLLSNIVINLGFEPVINKSEVASNKLPVSGIHSNYKLTLRK